MRVMLPLTFQRVLFFAAAITKGRGFCFRKFLVLEILQVSTTNQDVGLEAIPHGYPGGERWSGAVIEAGSGR